MAYYPPVPPPAVQRGTGLAVTALVLGITGLLFSVVPLIGIVAWPLVLAGIAFAIVALVSPRSGGKGVAVAGLVTSVIGLLVCIAYAAAFAAAFGGLASTPTGPQYSAPLASGDGTTTLPTGAFGDGTYEIGVDIPPGTYRTDASGTFTGTCYWGRHSDASGDLDAIEANGLVQGPGIVEVRGDGYLELSGGCVWAPE